MVTSALTRPAHAQSPALLYLARLAPTGRKAQKIALETLAKLLTGGGMTAMQVPWGQVRYEHAQALRAQLAERYAPATANRMLSALRGVVQEAWRLGQIPVEQYHQVREVDSIEGSRLPAGREVTRGELSALFADARNNNGAARDLALLAVLYGCGLRRTEAAKLTVANYNVEDGTLRFIGKRNKERKVFVEGGARFALEAWLRIRGDAEGAIFSPVNKVGRVVVRQMTDVAIQRAVKRMQLRAGVKDFTPHDLRRSFISHMFDAGADLAHVQKLAGHSNPKTTTQYDRRSESSLRRTAALIHVPYQPRGVPLTG